MNFVVKGSLAGFVALIGLGPVSSFAQDASCSCATAYRGPANPIGSVVHARGDTMISQAAGYEPAKAGNDLDFGSRLVVGPKGAASVQVGDCRLDIPANSSLDISRVESNICLKVIGSEQTAAVPKSGQPWRFGPPEAFFAGALITSGVLAATQNNDNGVSR